MKKVRHGFVWTFALSSPKVWSEAKREAIYSYTGKGQAQRASLSSGCFGYIARARSISEFFICFL